jgi:hypothetical protein
MENENETMGIKAAFRLIGFAISMFMAVSILFMLLAVFVGCMTPKRFLKKHPEYAKVVHDTTIVTRHDTTILRKEVVVRDTIHHFSKLEINKEYIVRDTLNRVEIRYVRTKQDELQIQGKQLAGFDTLKNAITKLSQRQQLIKTITETKFPRWASISFVFLLAIILILLILRLLRK